jgi:hypothetical protein
MEDLIHNGMIKSGNLKDGIMFMRHHFFCEGHQSRTEKHFANLSGGAAGKRLSMFLRIFKVA